MLPCFPFKVQDEMLVGKFWIWVKHHKLLVKTLPFLFRLGLRSRTLPYLTYPIASCDIGKKAIDIWQTSSLRKCAEQVYQQVKDGEEVRDNDIEWLSEGKWNAIPWHKIEQNFL
jgi:hypothetical protein